MVGMSLSVGDRQIEREQVRNSFNELKVIKESLRMYGERYGKLPCPTPITLDKDDDNFGLPAADCDATPTAGVTHMATYGIKRGGVPYKVLGLSAEFAADEWEARYSYQVTDFLIRSLDTDDEGVVQIFDRGNNVITDEAAFAVYSYGKTGLGGINHDDLSSEACDLATLDAQNCTAVETDKLIDSSIRETDVAADFYDDLLIWSKRMNILNKVATITPEGPIAISCPAGAGVTINGIGANDLSGRVSNVGDVNGDGYSDFIIGASGGDPNGKNASGESYLIFGKAAGWKTDIDLTALDGTNGFVINGIDVADNSGDITGGGGDINGDGYDDILIGAFRGDPNGEADAGEGYVIFGKLNGWTPVLNLSTLDGTNGFVINGIDAGDRAGYAVSNAGDVNGDGFDDIIMGAYLADTNGADSGEAYLVFGKASGWPAAVELSTLEATVGILYNGVAAGDYAGNSVAGVGDVNADGYADFMIGALRADLNGKTNSGAGYLIFGKANGWVSPVELADLTLENGIVTHGADAGEQSNESLAPAGDVNNDGYDDILIGASQGRPNGIFGAGKAYIVFGKATNDWVSPTELSALNGITGTMFAGISPLDYTAKKISGVGDVNADGFDDIIIGAHGAENGSLSDVGKSYIVFGKAGGWGASSNLADLDGTDGFSLNGIAGADQSGSYLSSAGDVNNDGFDDFLIGAAQSDAGGVNSGQTYLIFGNPDWSSTSGVIELDALEDPAECTANACPLTVDVNLDANAAQTSWNIYRKSDKKKILKSDYSAADNNAVETINHALPRTAEDYVITLEDLNLDGFVSVSDKLQTTMISDISLKTGPTDFGLCMKEFTADSTCGFTNGATTNMVCGDGHCDPITGTVFNGTAVANYTGGWVSSAGDINNDGYDDFLIGALSETDPATIKSHIVFGKRSGFPATVELSALDGSDGFTINGPVTSGSAAGDVNNDGFNDVIVEVEEGAIGVIFGKASCWATSIDLTTLDGTNGFRVILDEHLHVAGVGDVNGDGFDDVLIAAGANDTGTGIERNYLILGKSSWSSSITQLQLNGDSGNSQAAFHIEGITFGDGNGESIAAAGDVNRDGFADIIIGAPQVSSDSDIRDDVGASYVVFGNASMTATGSLNLVNLNGSNGFALEGVAANDQSGSSVAGAGDVNGDGYDDIIIGALTAAPAGIRSGETYVVFGKPVGWASTLALSSLDGDNGFKLNGISADDNSGFSVEGIGDMNGDGYDDIIISAVKASPNGNSASGESYIIFGKAAGWTPAVELSSLNGTTGSVLNGVNANDLSGLSVAGAGDVNGDGYKDIIIGAVGADPNGNFSGAAYLVFGSPQALSASYNLSALLTPNLLCEGCDPSCASACNGTTWQQRACKYGSCAIINTVEDSPKCGPAVPAVCNVSCGGSYNPSPGDVCTDGTIYAGITPDGNVCMYTTPADTSFTGWATNSVDTGVDDEHTGKTNTDSLVALGAATYRAAGVCDALADGVHERDDWYLGALDEMHEVRTNATAIGGFTSAANYWTSTETEDDLTVYAVQIGNTVAQEITKTTAIRVRCVRKDTPAVAPIYCEQACGGSVIASPGDICDDGSVYIGISPDGNRCMYTPNSRAEDLAFLSSTAVSEAVTDDVTGEANTISLVGDGHNHTAARQCDLLTVHDTDDWYLPAKEEAIVVATNYSTLGPFSEITDEIWSSTTSATLGEAWAVTKASPHGAAEFTTNSVIDARCVRTDAASGGGLNSDCLETCGGTTDPSPGAICTNGFIYAGRTPDDGNCMYTNNADPLIVASPTPPGSDDWSTNLSQYVGANSAVSGTINTQILVTSVYSELAAEACEAYNGYSYIDWYLPAIEELDVLYANRVAIGDFAIGETHYWSSSEDDATNAFAVDFDTGLTVSDRKNLKDAIRCVRKDP